MSSHVLFKYGFNFNPTAEFSSNSSSVVKIVSVNWRRIFLFPMTKLFGPEGGLSTHPCLIFKNLQIKQLFYTTDPLVFLNRAGCCGIETSTLCDKVFYSIIYTKPGVLKVVKRKKMAAPRNASSNFCRRKFLRIAKSQSHQTQVEKVANVKIKVASALILSNTEVC